MNETIIEWRRHRETERGNRERERAIFQYREKVCFKLKELRGVGSSQTINYKTSQDAWLQLTSWFSFLILSYGLPKDNENTF